MRGVRESNLWHKFVAGVYTPDAIATVGCERYGWFSNQEIFGLPIDNASMTGWGTPPAPPRIGVIAPTATTCQHVPRHATTPVPVLDQLQYTTTKGSGQDQLRLSGRVLLLHEDHGDAGDGRSTSTRRTTALLLLTWPSLSSRGRSSSTTQRTCTKLKWNGSSVDGTVTGDLPSAGDFIIGVKYNPSALQKLQRLLTPPVDVLVRNGGGRRPGRHRRSSDLVREEVDPKRRRAVSA